jgi:hypothetical protein
MRQRKSTAPKKKLCKTCEKPFYGNTTAKYCVMHKPAGYYPYVKEENMQHE